MELSPERLVRVLIEAKVTPNRAKLAPHNGKQTWTLAAATYMAGSLPVIARRYHAQRQQALVRKGLLHHLRKFQTALGDALEIWDTALLEMPSYKREIEAVRLLHNAAKQNHRHILADPQKGKKPISTSLYLDLFDLYFELTGRTGLGNRNSGGPLHRFVGECAGLIDPKLEFPKPDAFRKLIEENDKSRRERCNLRCCNRVPKVTRVTFGHLK
jgi:hypothetical protein